MDFAKSRRSGFRYFSYGKSSGSLEAVYFTFKTSLYFLLSLIMCMSVCKHVGVNS